MIRPCFDAVICRRPLFRAHCLLALALALLLPAAPAHAESHDSPSDRLYSRALQKIEQQAWSEALVDLRQLQRRYPGFHAMAAVQTRVAVLQESVDAGASLPVFLRALALREAGEIDVALAALATIAAQDPAGTLTDDALYISAYLQVMDRYDYAAAREALKTLEQRFPASAYSDAAHYLDAIALEQLGQTEAARDRLLRLRERHTALELPLNFRWPRGSMLSRYWYDRADRRLAIVEKRLQTATRLNAKLAQEDDRLSLAVNVDGMDLTLKLQASPLTRETRWLDSHLQNELPPAIGVFDGQVEGVADSWVRVVLEQDSIRGVLSINGRQHRVHPANLIGTLDYYQPRSRRGETPAGMQSDLADSLQGLDVLFAPPESLSDQLRARSRQVQTAVRAVPMSIVIDSQFNRYHGGYGLSMALNNLNIADGVYRELGIALLLDEAQTLTAEADPMHIGPVSLETILRNFRGYRMQYETLFEDSALTYLFTGNPRSDSTLGLAWINTACRTDGYDVGVTTPSSFGDVLLSHELAHSLGAEHDTDTVCDDNPRSLMWPNISERTETQFSLCSREKVVQARTRACLRNIVDLHVAGSVVGDTVVFQIGNPDDKLTLDATLAIETSAPDQLQWPATCLALTPTSADCHIAGLQPGERRNIAFTLNQSFLEQDVPVTGQLLPLQVLELQPADNSATVSPLGGGSLPASNELAAPAVKIESTVEAGRQIRPAPGAASGGGQVDLTALMVVFMGIVLRLSAGWRNRSLRRDCPVSVRSRCARTGFRRRYGRIDCADEATTG